MNIRDLKYLVCLADVGHFGKAADACFVSQPALSIQIKKLELDLGVQLFERTHKAVSLTDTGVTLVALARQILQQVEELKAVAQLAINPLSGPLRLGIFPTLAPYLLPHIMPQLSQRLPDVSFYLVEEKTNVLIEQLKSGELHAAFLSLPVAEQMLKSAHLFDEEFLLAVPHDHLLSRQTVIDPSSVDYSALLLLDDGHCMKNQVLDFCSHMQQPNAQWFRATSLEVLRHMVVSGMGVTFMPKLSTERCKLLSYLSVDAPDLKRSIGLVYRGSTSKQPLLNIIESCVKTIMNTVLLLIMTRAPMKGMTYLLITHLKPKKNTLSASVLHSYYAQYTRFRCSNDYGARAPCS